MQHTRIEPILRRHLLRLAHEYIKAKPKKNGQPYELSSIGRYARGDGRFFDLLEDQERKFRQLGGKRSAADIKGSFTLRVYDDIVAWFIENWPPGVEIPALDDLTHERKQDGESQNHPEAPGEKAESRSGTKAGGTVNLLARLRRESAG
jgi:hypothetical protein